MDQRRYYGFDALRGAMMMLGIVLHGAVFYLASPPPTMFIITDRNTSPVCDILFHFIHSFRMPIFFLLAGFFTALLVEKRGLWGTWKNRAARVLAPLLAAMVTMLPVAGLFMISFMVSARFGSHDLIPERAQLQIISRELAAAGVPVSEPSIGHLWFLYYLLYFYLLIPICRWLVAASRPAETGLRKALQSPTMLPVLGLVTAATLWPFHGGQVHEGFLFLKPHLPSLIYFGLFFVLGYVLHFYQEMLQAFTRFMPWCALLAAVLFPLSLTLSNLDNQSRGMAIEIHLAAVVTHGLFTWALIYALVGSALRYFDKPSPWSLYIAQSSYWVFLVHLPLVCIAAWLLVPYDLPALVKFAAVVGFTTVLSFASYHYAVQRTWGSAFLNGRRFDMKWPWQVAGAIAQVGEAKS